MSLVSSFSKSNSFTFSKSVQLGGFFFRTSKQSLKNCTQMQRKKQNGGRSGKEGRPISLLESALIFKKMQEFTHVVRMERIFFMWLKGMRVRRFPFCTIKKHTIHSVQQGVFIEYLVANEIIDQYRYA